MEILPFHMDHVPEFFMRKCKLELMESPENKVKSIEELRTMLKSDKKISRVNFHEDLLVQYLRRSKYDVKKSFKQIQNCIAVREKQATLFKSIPDEYFSSKVSTRCLAVLPKRCPEGCTIILCQFGLWDTSELSFEDFKRMALVMLFQILRDPMNQINGLKFIHDFSGASIHHLKYCTPQNMLLLNHLGLQCIPGRLKEIHCLYDSIVLKTLWAIAKLMLTEKIKQRVFIHSNPEELFDYFPRSVLPAEYGGEVQDIYSEDIVRKANKANKEYTVAGQANFY